MGNDGENVLFVVALVALLTWLTFVGWVIYSLTQWVTAQ